MGDEPSELPFSWTSVLRVYKAPIILGMVSIVFIALSITIFIKSYQATEPIRFSSDRQQQSVIGESSQSAGMSSIMVDVEGAVVHPGVYALTVGSRVQDAISASGGLTKQADERAIARLLNRAAKLSDGAKLYIPALGDANPLTGPGMVPSASSGQSGTAAGRAVNINSASQSEIEALSGIGPVTAGKIIAGRPYTRLEELVEKKGLSQSLFMKLKDQFSL